MQAPTDMFILGFVLGIVILGEVVILTILITRQFIPRAARPAATKEKFSPLVWATTLFSLWYTLLTVPNSQGFAWFFFVLAVILLFSVPILRLRKVLSGPSAIAGILPIIFIISIALFIFGLILSLQGLTNVYQIIALIMGTIILGFYLAIMLADYNIVAVRLILCAVVIVLFIFSFIQAYIAFEWAGSWLALLATILLIGQTVWATLEPARFRSIPIV